MRNDKVDHILCCLHVTLGLAIFLYKANVQDFMCILLSISLIPHPTNVVRACGDTVSKLYRGGCQRVCRKMMVFDGLSPILRSINGFKSSFNAQLCPLPIARKQELWHKYIPPLTFIYGLCRRNVSCLYTPNGIGIGKGELYMSDVIGKLVGQCTSAASGMPLQPKLQMSYANKSAPSSCVHRLNFCLVPFSSFYSACILLELQGFCLPIDQFHSIGSYS